MTTSPTYVHDPNANLPYRWDWSEWLEDADVISAHTVVVPTGLTLGTHDHTDTTVTAWISGWTAGTTYTVTCRITTVAGLIDDRSIRLRVAER
jgi:hypothetical protein